MERLQRQKTQAEVRRERAEHQAAAVVELANLSMRDIDAVLMEQETQRIDYEQWAEHDIVEQDR